MDKTDQWGMHTRNAGFYVQMYTAAGLKTVTYGENGMPEFTAPSNQAFADIYDWCTANFRDSGSTYLKDSSGQFHKKNPLFAEGRSLFTDVTFFYVGNMREMVSDFGMIVYPKYTAEQKEYYSWCEGGAKALGVSKITRNREAVGAALEALGTESLEKVIPTYYELNLKTKYSRDQISAQMFDLVRETRAFDMGDTIWSNVARGKLGNAWANGDPIVSTMETIKPTVITTIADTMAAMAAEK